MTDFLAPTRIGEDDTLMASGLQSDFDKVLQIQALTGRPGMCPVLAMPYMAGHCEFLNFNWSENAITHKMVIEEWTHLYGLAYEVKVASFEECAEPTIAPAGLEARINTICSGDANRISTIYGAELRVYPYSVLQNVADARTDEERDGLINQAVDDWVKPQHDAFRAHPEWADSLRYLARLPCYSAFYAGCAVDLVEVGIAQGYITRQDVENARRRKPLPTENQYVN